MKYFRGGYSWYSRYIFASAQSVRRKYFPEFVRASAIHKHLDDENGQEQTICSHATLTNN